MSGPAERAALYDSRAHVGKALSNGKRLELLELLAQDEHSVEALAHAANIRLTSVSAHLQILKPTGRSPHSRACRVSTANPHRSRT